MPEYHRNTDIEIPDAVPTSGFRSAIHNTKRYMKHNKKTLEEVWKAAYEGDLDLLNVLLATGDEYNLFNGDLNEHLDNLTPLMAASCSGQTECVELLLKARADPHMKERMRRGSDAEDGRTSLEFAELEGWCDIADILRKAEAETPFGWYIPEGTTNNKKMYGGYEHGEKPMKGWYSSRPGVAERNGFDPNKYGTGRCRVPPAAFPRPLPPPSAVDTSVSPQQIKASLPLIEPTVAPTKVAETIPVAVLFPGQGSQYVKMLSTSKDIPAVRDMLDTAKNILGYDILELCLVGPEERLAETRFCQPAMFMAGLAGMEKLRVEREEAATQFRATAGLSLGEYTALCVAGVFAFEDGLKLVKLRGEAMQEAGDASKQAMLSVAGLDKVGLADCCAEAAKKAGGQVCQIANELFPKGFACAGDEKAVHILKDLAEAAGALQTRILKTSGAFHTSLMAPAEKRLCDALDEVLPRMKPPTHTIYMNVTAAPLAPGCDPRSIVELLKRQLTSPVRWEATIRNMLAGEITEFYEVGPNKQLKAMMKRIDQKAWSKTANVDV
eukprot:TRINITY_DN1421_c0_g1_i3.p1 TRINITY_DN1421_c0_g1~~TRINITY_DN1421_c0_g1_i3.p1  ORF type:complete len:553 (+),score=119.39 TRINITY_DN1421_c0_g1_i3:83-1741(+)